jgi:hypothetical protein
MSNVRCPQKGCNAPARILFTLVCANPLCRNYDPKWHVEAYSEPRYKHGSMGENTFLGGFVYDNEYYDLYYSINPLDGSEWVEARFGNEFDEYMTDELVFADVHQHAVIREAARRWNEKL